MLDHIILTVSNFAEAVAFYEAVLPHLNMVERQDYDGKDRPPGHPDLKGFGANGRLFFWLREGTPHPHAVHVGFVADSEKAVQTAYSAALAKGATSKNVPGLQLHDDPRYYASQVVDLDGYTLEFVYKSWQH
jgi:catechol 2,3-dioxygenase-like lactoylglutathione lyase family enzyme